MKSVKALKCSRQEDVEAFVFAAVFSERVSIANIRIATLKKIHAGQGTS